MFPPLRCSSFAAGGALALVTNAVLLLPTLLLVAVTGPAAACVAAQGLERRYTENSTLPTKFGVLLFPTFQALDVFGPLDALNILSWSHTTMSLALIAPDLSPVATARRNDTSPPLPHAPFSQSVVPTHTYATAAADLDLEVLLVPGGLGTRDEGIEAAVEFVKGVYPRLRWLLTVCTGAGVAARAGVLDGRRATTNKKAWSATTALRPQVEWVPHARWVVDGNIWSSSGVSAGIDVTLAWMGEVFGESIAQGVADGMEYERHTDPDWDPFADLYGLS